MEPRDLQKPSSSGTHRDPQEGASFPARPLGSEVQVEQTRRALIFTNGGQGPRAGRQCPRQKALRWRMGTWPWNPTFLRLHFLTYKMQTVAPVLSASWNYQESSVGFWMPNIVGSLSWLTFTKHSLCARHSVLFIQSLQ